MARIVACRTTMSAITPPTRTSKRKRAPVNYCEDDFQLDNDIYGSDWSVEEQPLMKKKATPSNRPLPKRKIFPFLQLPRELRDMIYEYALVDETEIKLSSANRSLRRVAKRVESFDSYTARTGRMIVTRWHRSGRGNKGNTNLKPLATSLLASSRQIQTEAAPVLYSSNAFAFEDTTAMHRFLGNTSAHNRGLLRDLTLCGWGFTRARKGSNFPAFTILAAGGVKLDILRLECSILGWMRHADEKMPLFTAASLYREAFQWLEAVGAAKGRRDAAVDLVSISPRHLGVRTRTFVLDGAPVDDRECEAELCAFKEALGKLLRDEGMPRK